MSRLYSAPWKGQYGVDRHYTARVDRAKDRGQFTEPGTQPNGSNPQKVAHKRRAKEAARVHAA